MFSDTAFSALPFSTASLLGDLWNVINTAEPSDWGNINSSQSTTWNVINNNEVSNWNVIPTE